jgi:hypothetical protein
MNNFISRRLSQMARDRDFDLFDLIMMHEFVGQGTPVNLRHTLDVFEHMHKGKRTRIIGKSATIYPYKNYSKVN